MQDNTTIQTLIKEYFQGNSAHQSQQAQKFKLLTKNNTSITLRQLLESDDTTMQLVACHIATELKQVDLFDELLRHLDNPDENIRRQACSYFAMIRDPGSLAPLLARAKTADGNYDLYTLQALCFLREPATLDLWADALKFGNQGIQYTALRSLMRLNTEPAVAILLDQLGSTERGTQMSIINALGNMRAKSAVPDIAALYENEYDDVFRMIIVRNLGLIGGNEAINLLIRALNDDNPDIRATAAEMLGKMKAKQAVEALIEALNYERQRDGRLTIIKALGNIADSSTADTLLQLLKGNWHEQMGAAHALANLGDLRAVEPVIELLNSDHPMLCDASAYALGRLGDLRAVNPLITLLKNQPVAQSAAIKALAKLGDSRAIDPLIAALNSPLNTTQQAAAMALASFKEPRTIEPLIATFHSKYWPVRRAVVYALGEIGNPYPLGTLRRALGDPDPGTRINAAHALRKCKSMHSMQLLQAAFTHEHEGIRDAAALSMAVLGNPAAVNRAIELLTAKRYEESMGAVNVLLENGSPEAIDAIFDAISNSDNDMALRVKADALRVLTQNHHDRVLDLIQFLLQEEAQRANILYTGWVYDAVISVLREINTPQARQMLRDHGVYICEP